MPPFQWCHGCSCSLGLIYTPKPCTMPPITFQDLPLNIYMVIFGTGIFVFVLSLIFCCYFISKLRHQAQSERFGYKEVVLKGDARRLNSARADLCRLPGGFQSEGGAGGAAVPARLPPKVPGEVAGGALRVPHVQQAHGGAGTAPRRHRDAAGRAGVSGPVSLGGTNASSRRIQGVRSWGF
uniref:Ring finger protein 122 n=1 Tax=Anas platyrhynchos TaxID=8839 RepID=A0A8B9SW20_ANAPL